MGAGVGMMLNEERSVHSDSEGSPPPPHLLSPTPPLHPPKGNDENIAQSYPHELLEAPQGAHCSAKGGRTQDQERRPTPDVRRISFARSHYMINNEDCRVYNSHKADFAPLAHTLELGRANEEVLEDVSEEASGFTGAG